MADPLGRDRRRQPGPLPPGDRQRRRPQRPACGRGRRQRRHDWTSDTDPGHPDGGRGATAELDDEVSFEAVAGDAVRLRIPATRFGGQNRKLAEFTVSG